ncbi:hypothetical protein P3T76_011049 [Phytophthora citrophthora]|uniref:Uncharacterized protein n=1 Tax=Phytophthora citrophthora TaxID=4793 RepID=A0AAD9G9V3_9STRA|nr:hypothetical protein P3T76_011049 [Phytophthora citrophthora]
MERKVPPPGGFGAPPVVNGAQPQPFKRRSGPPLAFGTPPAANSEQNAPPPPPQQPQSFGFQTARGPVNTNVGMGGRGWKPGRVGGRHDSPLYGKHRKRPSSSSIDSNVSWSGSEIESIGGFGAAHTEEQARLSWTSSVATKEEAPSAAQQDLASASSLFGAPAHKQQPQSADEIKPTVAEAGMTVQPPKTPLGKPTQDAGGEISATQRIRMGLSEHVGSRAGSRANSSENVFANAVPPVYDEEKSGPQSCPSTFNNTKQPQFSIDKLRQLRSNELVASKLLPTRNSVNSLMGYVRELQLSEATLRKQLVTTKQHTEEELSQSLSKVTELERTVHEVERDRELARRKLEEQEQLIRDLAAKLKQAEAAKAKTSTVPAVDELPPIAEEPIPQSETEGKPTVGDESKSEATAISPPKVTLPPPSSQQPSQPPMLPGHSDQSNGSRRAAQFGLASPRSPNRPLWDPWASGGVTPMKNLPPAFTIGSTGLDPVASSSPSTTQAPTTDVAAPGEYELKSVLMSPRRHDESAQAASQMDQNEFPQEGSVPQHSMGAMPSPLYPQQQDFSSPEAQNEAYGIQGQDDVPLMESPSQVVPMLPAERVTLNDTLPVQQGSSNLSAQENAIDASGGEWNEIPAQQEVLAPAVSFLSPADIGGSEARPSPPQAVADQSALPPPTPQAVGDHYSPEKSDEVAPPETDNAEVSIPATPPVESTYIPPPQASEIQPPHPEQDTIAAPAEPVSLETLLVDFFTEVDKKRLKMAKVYGKRYEGREKWLFAELSKRYGAAKVAALKARYENGSGSETSATTSSSGPSGKTNEHTSKPTDVSKSDQPKSGRQGHPRPPQFFHPPAPAKSVDMSAGSAPVPPPAAVSESMDAPIAEADDSAEGSGTTAVSLETKASPGEAARVSPRRRQSGGNVPPFTTASPSFPGPQGTGEGSKTSSVSLSGPPIMTTTRPSVPREEPARHVNKHPPPPPFQARRENTSLNDINNANAEPVGLRQRHNAPRPNAQDQKSAHVEPPVVTLEGLLKELYKKHQPDKLKNVSIVAKQYAGKERELVGLLKGKYGALSVKHLEENLEVLERAHVAHMASTGAGKKRGCVVRTISLVFWVSVVLYFSFGAVFVSFVVLDVWECHSLESDDQELEAEECAPLKKELETFTYEHVADYVSQSHPESCFCSEWKARESVLFANLSGDDLLNLVRLVPFSPESFGAPWIASVKEQVPSQEFYDSYAKPVVDVSLDVGSFVWSSVLELVGYDETSEQSSEVVRGGVVEDDDKEAAPLMDEDGERDMYSDSLEQTSGDVDDESLFSDVDEEHVLTKDSETEVEAGSAAMPETMAQVPVEEEIPVEVEVVQIDEELQIDEVEVAALDEVSVKDSVADEEPAIAEEQNFSLVEDVVSIAEESAIVDEENISSVEDVISEEESINVENKNSPVAPTTEGEEVVPEDILPGVEESELVDTSKELAEVAVETLVEDDSNVEGSAIVDEEDVSSIEDVIAKEEESVVMENESPVASVVENEEEAPVESIDLVEADDFPDVEESEVADDSEEPSEAADGEVTDTAAEGEVIDTLAETSSVVTAIVENESVEEEDDDDAEVSVASEDEVSDEAVDTEEQVHEAVVEEVSDSASVEDSEVSVEKNALSDDVVEVEVRQEGLDLSYPETDEKDSLAETVTASSVEGGLESVASTDEDVSPLETEPELMVESDNISDDILDKSDTVDAVVDSKENLASLSDTDVDVAEVESVDVAEVESVDSENETAEEDLGKSDDLDTKASIDLSQESVSVVEEAASDSMAPTDVDEVQAFEDTDGADPGEAEVDDDRGDEELDAVMDVDAAVDTVSDEEEIVISDESDVSDMVSEAELPTGTSSDIDDEEPLSEESSDDMPAEVSETISDEGHDEAGSVSGVDEETSEVAASNDEDDAAIPADIETITSEVTLEEDGLSESDDEVAEALLERTENEAEGVGETSEELAENVDNEAEDVADVVDVPSDMAAEEGVEVEEVTEAGSEAASVDEMVSENAEDGNDDAESATPREIEAEPSVSEVGLFSELVGEESVAIEATEVSIDADAASVEEMGEAVDVVDSEEVESTDGAESAVVADEEASNSAEASAVSAVEDVPVDDAVEDAVPVDAKSLDDLLKTDTDELPATDSELVSEQEVEDASTSASEDKVDGGLVSVVNDVLARLVEPFEAAKTAMPVVEGEEKNVTPQPSQPKSDNNATSSRIYEHAGAHGALNTVSQRSWRPEPSVERHNSLLFKKHHKHLAPSSVDTGPSIKSEASAASNAQKPELKVPSKVDTKVPTPLTAVKMELRSIQPPRTPQGNATDSIFHEGGLSASQRVRMELSAHSGSRAGSGSRSNSSEDIFAAKSPVSDEKKHGPRSCPTSFTDRRTKMSPGRRRQSDSIVSKLLPTRDSINSMLAYLHELQRSETSLRKQLMTTKQHTETDLHQSLSKLSELQRTIHQVERERQLAVQKLDEKDQRILELTAKLKEAEAAQAKGSPVTATVGVSCNGGLPSIAEEAMAHTTTEPQISLPDQEIPGSSIEEISALKAEVPQPYRQPSQLPRPLQVQSVMDEAAQFDSLSPRSPNRPLWDPWASGGTTPMKNLPPVFTIGSTGLDPIVTASHQRTIRDEDHELRSILMSPRQAQAQLTATKDAYPDVQAEMERSGTLEPQCPAPVVNVGSTASLPPYSQEQEFHQVKLQEAPCSPDAPTKILSTSTDPLQMDPMLYIGVMPPIHESPFEENSPVTRDSGVDETLWHDMQTQDEVQPPATQFPRNQMKDKETMDITGLSFNSRSPVGNGRRHNADDASIPGESTRIDRPEEVASGEPKQNVPAKPVNSTPLTPDLQPPHPASPSQQEATDIANTAEPVSLETLLVDFFTEVDKKRLKMAKVYGKRYEGREKWLFAELSKRYGAVKVAALKARYENGSGSETSATTSSSGPSGKTNEHTSKPTDVSKSDQPKSGRQGHPRPPQFFHPPAPAKSVDMSAGSAPVPPPAAVSESMDAPIAEADDSAEGSGTTAVSLETKASPGEAARVSPRRRQSGGNVPPFTTASPSFPGPQGTEEGSKTSSVSLSGPPIMTTTRPSVPREEPARHVNKHPPPPSFQARRENTSLNDINNANAEPVGLRQRHNAPRPNAQDQKSAHVEPPVVTLEGLLKELYKKHQPDKLKNVSIVAKQYAGKERELVGLLKGKYGALSVKHLEENLEVLERAHVAHMASTGAGKKRGCVVRTISLVFWVSVVLYFSFGAVFVSFVVLDVWECHSLESDDQELEAEECAPLKKELETFTYEHVADYVSQSHPESCFCSEWKARESALFANLSGDDLLNLVRLVPFSPESFGAPWIASVKEQVPSQEFYDSYAKPVVDVSLDVGSFVWSSVLELVGYDETSEQSSEVVRGGVVEDDDKEAAPLMDEDGERDMYSDSLEQTSGDVDDESLFSDVDEEHVLTKDSETEVEAGSAAMPETMAQVPVEEEIPVEVEVVQINEELQIDEVEVAALDEVSVKDSVADEEPAIAEEQNFSLVEDVVSIAEESAIVDEENVSSVDDVISEEESINVENKNSPVAPTTEGEEVVPEDILPGVEESELVDTSKELAEVGVETLVEDDSNVEGSAIVDEEDASSIEDVIAKEEESVVMENESPVASVVENEEEAPVESIDLVEADDFPDVEESEVADDSEEPSEAADGEVTDTAAEGEVIDTLAETSSVVTAIVENESVEEEDDDDAEVSVASEDEVSDEAVDTEEQVHEAVVEEVSDSASVEDSEVSVEKNALSDDVVEVEVRQEGLDLSYPETDEKDSLAETVTASSVEGGLESVVSTDEDVSPLETEPELMVESDNISDDILDKSDTVDAVVDSKENLASLSDTDVDVAEVESVDVAEVESVDSENETAEEDLGKSDDLDTKASIDLSQESVSVVEEAASDSMAPTDVDEVQAFEDTDGADPGEAEVDDDRGDEELDAVMDVDAAVDTVSGEEEIVISDESDVSDMVSEAELPTGSSSDIDDEEPLSEESSDDMPAEVSETISDEGHDEAGSVSGVDEETSEVAASNDEDDAAIPADIETITSEVTLEEDGLSESDDEVAEALLERTENEAEGVGETGEELAENVDNEAEDVADVVDVPSDMAAEEGVEVEEVTEAGSEAASVDEMVSENAEDGNDDAESATPREIEAEPSVSEVGLFSELVGEESVAIEATEVSIDADAASVEEMGEAVDVVDSEEVESTDGAESAVVADEEASNSAEASAVSAAEDVPVDDAVEDAVPVTVESVEELLGGATGDVADPEPVDDGEDGGFDNKMLHSGQEEHFVIANADESDDAASAARKSQTSVNTETVEPVDDGDFNDDDEEGEIAFMEELEDPEEVLRMAEQAAAAAELAMMEASR